MSSHGCFVWYVLTTTDMVAAKTFYANVVGWGTRDASMPGLPYTVFVAGTVPICGVTKTGARDRGPGWIGYVCVDDVDTTANGFALRGGAVLLAPQDILDVSRFSIVADPQTATLALVESLKAEQDPQPPADVRARGQIGWHELHAADWEKVWGFYSEQFGWQRADATVSVMGAYQRFSAGGRTIGAMCTKPPHEPVPCWLYYFNVGDIDAAVKRVKDGGGNILRGPVEVPGGDWIVQCTDPQGVIFALSGTRGFGYFAPAAPPQNAA